MNNAGKPINPLKRANNAFYDEKDEPFLSRVKPLIGLTKREHYAGLAMQGLLANCNGGMTSGGNHIFSPSGISELAVLHADELLKQLEKK